MDKPICKLSQTAPAAEASESGAAPAAATEQPSAKMAVRACTLGVFFTSMSIFR